MLIPVIIVLFLSLLLQFIAAIYALWLIRMTGMKYSWMFISIALFLMGIRRIIPLYANFENINFTADLSGEIIWLILSIFMLLGIRGIGKIFIEVKLARKTKSLLAEKDIILKKYKNLSNQLEAILDHIPGLVFYKDKKNNFIRVNKYVAEAYKKDKVELEGKSIYELYSKEEAEKYYQDDLSVINSGVAKMNIEEQWRTADGIRWVNTSKIPFVNEDGEIIGVIGMSMDITEKKHAEQQIQNLVLQLEMEKNYAQKSAITDSLTRLANRRYFDEILNIEFFRMKRSKEPLSLIMLDIDHFKKFNDRYGHLAGDDCLVKVAAAIKAAVRRAPDIVARYGGEEFVVVLPNTHNSGAAILAERIRKSVEALAIAHSDADTVEYITISLGVITVDPTNFFTTEQVVKLADDALYRAKKGGRNRVETAIYSAESGSKRTEEKPGFVQLIWHHNYECGNPTIDSQHRKLFNDANTLLSAVIENNPMDECNSLLKNIYENVVSHFHDEEIILASSGYPLAENHCRCHAELVTKAKVLKKKYNREEMKIGELFSFLVYDVVARHMHIEDRKFFPYV